MQLSHVDGIVKNELRLTNGECIPISRSLLSEFKHAVLAAMEDEL